MKTVFCLDKSCCLVIEHDNGEPSQFGERIENDGKTIDLWW